MKNQEVLDALSEATENTINHFIDKDTYYFVAPYLSKKVIDKACPFFDDNRISLTAIHPLSHMDEVIYPRNTLYPSNSLYPKSGATTHNEREYTDDDLRTISYLSLFQRNRVAYNPKNIDFYLRTLGYMKNSETAMNILCFEEDECGAENRNIDYKDWVFLP